jgi:hypothetical protein
VAFHKEELPNVVPVPGPDTAQELSRSAHIRAHQSAPKPVRMGSSSGAAGCGRRAWHGGGGDPVPAARPPLGRVARRAQGRRRRPMRRTDDPHAPRQARLLSNRQVVFRVMTWALDFRRSRARRLLSVRRAGGGPQRPSSPSESSPAADVRGPHRPPTGRRSQPAISRLSHERMPGMSSVSLLKAVSALSRRCLCLLSRDGNALRHVRRRDTEG